MGRERYPEMKELTITADCGGSNGARVRLWKIELQKLADETNLTLSVHHDPPGTSKWNRIEHRLFCHITQNWRGRPLTDRIAVVELIGATTTKAGLKVECALDERTYEKGIKVRGDCPEFRVWFGHNGKRGAIPWPDARNPRSRMLFLISFLVALIPRRPLIGTAFWTI